MNLFCKLGLAALAGAAVLLGINRAEKCNVTTNTNGGNNNIPSSDENNSFSSPEINNEQPNDNKKSDGFIKKVKKTQAIVEAVSRVVTCVYRICECISEMFGKKNYSRSTYSVGNGSYGSTTIIL